jgi:nucleotide-binding universal stress UspA family protein
MNILVCVDLSQATAKIVKNAEELAKATSAKLWILHVAEPEPDFIGFDVDPQTVRDSLAENFHQEHRQIQAIADRMREDSLDTVALLVQGSTAETILMEASKISADMIILGSHGKGVVSQLLVGSVSEVVIHKAECPILIIPTHGRA